MSKPVSGLFGGTVGCKKSVSDTASYNAAKSTIVKKVDHVIILNEAHHIPKDSNYANAVIKSYTKGTLKTERYFDEYKMPYLDIDYSDHGNTVLHPVVPHQHKIIIKDGKIKRGKWEEIA